MGIVKQLAEKASRKSLMSSASVLGLAAGAVGWSGLAQAASGETGSQLMLLPEHYELMQDGVVVFSLQTGEQLTLNPGQYVILQDGLLLITDELTQASMDTLPVMGSIRAQLTSELQPVRSPDGSVVQASDASPLWSGEGLAPRLFEEVDIQRFELAQNSSDTQTQSEANLGQAAGAAAGGLSLAGLSLLSSIPGTEKPEQSTEEEESSAPALAPAPTSEPEFLSDAMFQALTPTNARVFTGSAANSFLGYTTADPNATDALIYAGTGAGNSATFNMTAGGDNLLLVDDDAGRADGSFAYTGGSGKDDLTFGDDLGRDAGNVTLNVGDGDNTLSAGNDAGASWGGLSYTGGSGKDDLAFGPTLGAATGSAVINAGNGDNTLSAGNDAGAYSGDLRYTGGTGSDVLTFGDSLAITGGNVQLDLGSDTAADIVTFQGTIGKSGGSVTIKNFNYNHDTIDVAASASTTFAGEINDTGGNLTWTDSLSQHTIVFEGIGTGGTGVQATAAQLIADII